MNALQTTASGILDSAVREYRGINLESADSVQDCSDAYADRILTHIEAERVRAACLDWIAADDLDTITYDSMIASLGDEADDQ